MGVLIGNSCYSDGRQAGRRKRLPLLTVLPSPTACPSRSSHYPERHSAYYVRPSALFAPVSPLLPVRSLPQHHLYNPDPSPSTGHALSLPNFVGDPSPAPRTQPAVFIRGAFRQRNAYFQVRWETALAVLKGL
ncbi:hypothetical protein VTN31DRAFT_5510 [Thermomyces dupontii]|uniref:uncharacterized protein n=1 Tax=Talaromyces thermophilus TaxID=28565 RepID=UPI0037445860